MHEPQPADVDLPATVSVDLSHLVAAALALSMADHPEDSERAA